MYKEKAAKQRIRLSQTLDIVRFQKRQAELGQILSKLLDELLTGVGD